MDTRGVVVQLLGFPGTGKLTVAREIVALLEAIGRPARLLDNHASGDLVLNLVPRQSDGISPAVAQRIWEVRAAVLGTLEELTPRDWSVVFTNFVPLGTPAHRLDRQRAVADARGSAFLAVELRCERQELLRRVVADDRTRKHKLVDPARLEVILAEGMAMPDWPDIRVLDVTELAPTDAARSIIAMLPER